MHAQKHRTVISEAHAPARNGHAGLLHCAYGRGHEHFPELNGPRMFVAPTIFELLDFLVSQCGFVIKRTIRPGATHVAKRQVGDLANRARCLFWLAELDSEQIVGFVFRITGGIKTGPRVYLALLAAQPSRAAAFNAREIGRKKPVARCGPNDGAPKIANDCHRIIEHAVSPRLMPWRLPHQGPRWSDVSGCGPEFPTTPIGRSKRRGTSVRPERGRQPHANRASLLACVQLHALQPTATRWRGVPRALGLRGQASLAAFSFVRWPAHSRAREAMRLAARLH